jgi:ABC-2 type transport system permease protein
MSVSRETPGRGIAAPRVSRHLPLHLPAPFQLPAAVGALLLGAAMVATMLRILFRPDPGHGPTRTAGSGDGDGSVTAVPEPSRERAETADRGGEVQPW